MSTFAEVSDPNTSITNASETQQPRKHQHHQTDLEPLFISQKQGWTMAGLGKTCFYELKRLGYFRTYSHSDSSVPGSTRVVLNRAEFVEDATNYWNNGSPRHAAVGDD